MLVRSFSQLAKGLIALILTLGVVSSAFAGGKSFSVNWVGPGNTQFTTRGANGMLLSGLKRQALAQAGLDVKYSDTFHVVNGCGAYLDETRNLAALNISGDSLLILTASPIPCGRRLR